MAKYKSYWEKLKDPRWQKMRLEIMQRDQFTCQECEDKSNTLNVHHTYYEKGCDPWGYPEDSFVTLCESCHEKRTKALARLNKTVGAFTADDIDWVLGFAAALSTSCITGDAIWIDNPELSNRQGLLYGILHFCASTPNIDAMAGCAVDGRIQADDIEEMKILLEDQRRFAVEQMHTPLPERNYEATDLTLCMGG